MLNFNFNKKVKHDKERIKAMHSTVSL